MKRWMSYFLCLSLLIGLGTSEAMASREVDAKENGIKEISVAKAVTETASVESGGLETASPTPTPVPLPPQMGNVTVKEDTVFSTKVDTKGKTCVITGYTGNVSLTTIYIPASIKGNRVTAIEDQVFKACPYLKNVVFAGDPELKGGGIFYAGPQGVRPELWGKNAGKVSTYALMNGLVFHALDVNFSVSGKKESGFSKASLTWAAVNGAGAYQVYRKSGTGKYAMRSKVETTSFADSGLKAGVKYTYKVCPIFTAADGEQIEGYASKEVSIAMVPAKLKGVRAYGVRGGVQVRWKRNKNVSGYQVYMKVHVKGFKTKFNRVKTIKKNKITGYRYKMAVRGMKYSYRVRSFKKVGSKKIFSPFVTVTAKAK